MELVKEHQGRSLSCCFFLLASIVVVDGFSKHLFSVVARLILLSSSLEAFFFSPLFRYKINGSSTGIVISSCLFSPLLRVAVILIS